VTLLSKPVPTRTQIGDPKRRCGAGYRPLPTLCVGVASFVALTCGFQANGVAEPIQQLKGNAVIVGTVVDENHVPVARAQVQAFSAEDVQRAPRGSQRLARSAGSTSTDGTGSFQISGLAAGDYIVAAEAIPTFPNGGPPPARVYGPTFYPSTLDFSQAVVVNALDHQPPTVQIELVPVKPVRVTGTIISASGGSTEGFDVRLFRRFGGFGSGATLAAVREKGKFEIPRVPPGSYELTVEPHASRFGQESREFVDTMIDVKDHDVDLSLTVGRGASLTGHVVVEPAGAATTPIGLRVTANKAHEQFAGGSAIATAVNADWSFRMTGLSGSYEFLVSSDRPPPVVAATRIVVDGTSYATAAGITLAEGDHDVVVFVAPRDAPKPTVDSTQNSSALVQQFKNEKVFWKQIEMLGRLLPANMTRACCRRSPTGLVIRIVTFAETSPSSSPASTIRADCRRSPISSPTGRNDPKVKESPQHPAMADTESSGKLPQTVTTRRISSAICEIRAESRCSYRCSTILRRNQSCPGRSAKSAISGQSRL
jgi:hypothetical protein